MNNNDVINQLREILIVTYHYDENESLKKARTFYKENIQVHFESLNNILPEKLWYCIMQQNVSETPRLFQLLVSKKQINVLSTLVDSMQKSVGTSEVFEKTIDTVNATRDISHSFDELHRMKMAEGFEDAAYDVLPPLDIPSDTLEMIETLIEDHCTLNPRLLLLRSVKRVLVSNIYENFREKKGFAHLCGLLTGLDLTIAKKVAFGSLIPEIRKLEIFYDRFVEKKEPSLVKKSPKITSKRKTFSKSSQKSKLPITVLVYNETSNEYIIGEWSRIRDSIPLVRKDPDDITSGWMVVDNESSGRWKDTDVIKTVRKDDKNYDKILRGIEKKNLANQIRVEDLE